MEWAIPVQKLEVGKVHVGPLQGTNKPLTPLAYRDGHYVLPHCNILLPPLTVKEYNPATGRLILSLDNQLQVSAKLLALQETLLSTVYLHQRHWFQEPEKPRDLLVNSFQPFVQTDSLSLFCPRQTNDKRNPIAFWSEGDWKNFHTSGQLHKGDSIRVGLRLQGISFQTHPPTGIWTGRFRVQHRIFCIYKIPSIS
jgi:hypothetical protein